MSVNREIDMSAQKANNRRETGCTRECELLQYARPRMPPSSDTLSRTTALTDREAGRPNQTPNTVRHLPQKRTSALTVAPHPRLAKSGYSALKSAIAWVNTGSCCIRTVAFEATTGAAAARRPMKADRETVAL